MAIKSLNEIDCDTPLESVLNSEEFSKSLEDIDRGSITMNNLWNRQYAINAGGTSGGLSSAIMIDNKYNCLDYSMKIFDKYNACGQGFESICSQAKNLAEVQEYNELCVLKARVTDKLNILYDKDVDFNSDGSEKFDSWTAWAGRTDVVEYEDKLSAINSRLSKLKIDSSITPATGGGSSQTYTEASDADKKKITIQNAISAPDSEWSHDLPETDGGYDYITVDGVKVKKFVRNGHVVCYIADDEGDVGQFFFDSSGNEISYNEYFYLRTIESDLEGDLYKKKFWSKNSGNYSYDRIDDDCTAIIATGSDGNPLYYVVCDGDETLYYNSNFERISAEQVDEIVSTNKLTPVNIPSSSSGGKGHIEPTCDPTDPSTEPSTVPPEEPSTVPPEDDEEGRGGGASSPF